MHATDRRVIIALLQALPERSFGLPPALNREQCSAVQWLWADGGGPIALVLPHKLVCIFNFTAGLRGSRFTSGMVVRSARYLFVSSNR